MVNSCCLTEKTPDLGISTCLWKLYHPEKQMLPLYKHSHHRQTYPLIHVCRGGSMAHGQQSSEDVGLPLGRREEKTQCVKSRFSQQWGSVPWRKQGLLKERSRSIPGSNMRIGNLWGHRLQGVVGAHRVGENSSGDRAQVGSDARGTCLCHCQPREVPLQQVTSWPTSSPTRVLLRC